jgi:hypothetical protein
MAKPISERQKRKVINAMVDAVLEKITKRRLLKKFRDDGGDKIFYPGDILTVRYEVEVKHQFPDN